MRKGTLIDIEFVKANFQSSDDYKNFVLDYIPPDKVDKEIVYLTID